MPDEETTAVEEPDAPPVIETPTEPPVEETPTEAVPTSDQEPSPSEESGDQKKADEAPSVEQVRQDFLDSVEELRKSDPELAAEMSERFGVKEQDVGEERLQWERERGTTERTQRWNQARGVEATYAPEAILPQLVEVMGEMNKRFLTAATDLHEGRIDNPNQVQIDPNGWAQVILKAVTPLLTGGQGAARDVVLAATHSIISDVMEKHQAYTYLSVDGRKQLQQALSAGNYDEALTLWGNAALGAAPEEAVKKANKQAKEDAGLLDRYAKLKEGIGKNGKGTLTGGTAAKGGPTTLEEIDEALRTGPTAAIDGLLKRRAALIE